MVKNNIEIDVKVKCVEEQMIKVLIRCHNALSRKGHKYE